MWLGYGAFLALLAGSVVVWLLVDGGDDDDSASVRGAVEEPEESPSSTAPVAPPATDLEGALTTVRFRKEELVDAFRLFLVDEKQRAPHPE